MTELVRFPAQDGAMVVEVDQVRGLEDIARDDDGIVEAGQRLETVLSRTRPTLEALTETLRRMAPDEFEVEFGIKFNMEAGVVIAKTATEAHFSVRMLWQRSASETPAPAANPTPAPNPAPGPAAP